MEEYKNFDNLFDDPIEIIPKTVKKKSTPKSDPPLSTPATAKVEETGTSGGTKKGKKEIILPEPASSIKDKELNEKLDHVLHLAELGKSHELTEENMIFAIKMKKTVKSNDLRWYFNAYDSIESERLLKSLYNKKIVRKNGNGWYYLSKIKKCEKKNGKM